MSEGISYKIKSKTRNERIHECAEDIVRDIEGFPIQSARCLKYDKIDAVEEILKRFLKREKEKDYRASFGDLD